MGGLRIHAVHVFGDGRRLSSRSPGPAVRRLLGEGRRHQRRVLRHDYGALGRRDPCRALTGVYMTRQYCRLLRQRAFDVRGSPLAVSGGAETARRGSAADPTPGRRPASLTVGSARRRPRRAGRPARGADHVVPIPALAFLAFVGGLLDLPFTKLEFLNHCSSRCSGVAAPEPHDFWSAFGAQRDRGPRRAHRHRVSPTDLPPRPRAPGQRSARSWLGGWAVCRARLVLRRGRRRRGRRPDPPAREVARGRGRREGHRRRGQRHRGFARGRRGAQVQTGLVRQYTLGIAIGAVAFLLWDVIRAGNVRG